MKSMIAHNESFYDEAYQRKNPILYYLKNRYVSFAHRSKWAPVLSRVSVRRKKCLEVGFGSGVILLALAKRNTVFGLELSQSAISCVSECATILGRRNIHLTKYGGLGSLPVSGKFDVVISSHVLEHVPDDNVLMGELSKVLDIKGQLCLQLPVEEKEFPVLDANHVRNYTLQTVRTLLKRHGFEIEDFVESGYSNAFLRRPRHPIVRIAVKTFMVLTPYRLFLGMERLLFRNYIPTQVLAICRKREEKKNG